MAYAALSQVGRGVQERGYNWRVPEEGAPGDAWNRIDTVGLAAGAILRGTLAGPPAASPTGGLGKEGRVMLPQQVTSPASSARPSREEYFMGIAMAVRERANCKGSRVGAVLVREDRIISTGYNGVPEDLPNCEDDGCHRCAHRKDHGPGEGYDRCVCVHAEQNALIAAARFGIAVEDAVLYTTKRPCPGCTKELIQAKIRAVWYLDWWEHPVAEVHEQHLRIEPKIPEGVKRLSMDDPKADWAAGREPPADTGHAGPLEQD